MTPTDDLAVIRRAYARQIVHAAGMDDARLEAALATLPREAFLGPGPWEIGRFPGGPQTTPDADPVYLYQDMPVSILAGKQLNNGQPSFLAMLIGLCAVREGDRVVHIGTGTGYYTAILAHLAGAKGRVLGIEFEAALAARAADNLSGFANTTVVRGDGWTHPLEPADAILVNAGSPRPAKTWLDALAPGGRLVLPLAVRTEADGRPEDGRVKDGHVKEGHAMTRGVIFLVTRDADGYAAACKSSTLIYPCRGASEPAAEAALAAALEGEGAAKVTRLRREPVAESRCWLRGPGWSLTYD